MPDSRTSCPTPTAEEIAAILEMAPFEPDAYQVIPADGDYPLVVSIARAWPEPAFLSWGLAPSRWMPRSLLIPVQAADPGYESGAFADVDGWSRPIEDLVRCIPQEICEAVEPLPSCFQWYAIKMLAKVPEFIDVVVEQPVLAGMLAQQHHPRGDDVPEALSQLRQLLSGPRRRLLGLLDLPEQKWVLRALQKVDIGALISPGPPTIDSLLRADHKYIRRSLQHLPRLRADVLKIIADKGCWPMTTFALLADDDEDDIWDDSSLHELLVEILVAREDKRVPKKPARFRSRKQVLDTWMAIEPWDPTEQFPDPFEAPTGEVTLRLSGEPTITLTPLLAADEVFEHGIAQVNCLASDKQYFVDVSTGYTALYAVSWQPPGDGERATATLSVRQRWDADWEVLQFLGPENSPVPGWLALRVGDWVDEINRLGEDVDTVPPVWLAMQDDEGVEQLALPFVWRSRLPTPMEVPCWL